MAQQNSSIKNVRRYFSDISTAINGYRTVFLPGVGRYKGTWKNNLREGHGTLYGCHGIIYEGDWRNDRRHGYGLLKRKSHSGSELIYNGQWKWGKKHGDGTAYYDHGVYEGQWKNNSHEGEGIMWFHDGSWYFGEWKMNLFDGCGVHCDVDGNIYKGYFRNGVKCGEGTLHLRRNGQIKKGIWIDDCCVTATLQENECSQNIAQPNHRLPKVGLENYSNVVNESLRNTLEKDKLLKRKQKGIENFYSL